MKKNVINFVNKKFVVCAALIAAATTTAMAQGNGLAGINEATSMVSSYFEPAKRNWSMPSVPSWDSSVV